MSDGPTHRSRLGCLVIDCKTSELSDATDFWSKTFGYRALPDPAYPEYVMLETPDGEPKMLLQAVDHDSRIHIDIEADDEEAEAGRLEGLGAKRIAAIKGWIVMEAPTGHRFCIVGPQRPDFETNATAWDNA
ncbi:MAG: VOC family protein [Pseudomonadota bacterium]